MLSQATIKLHWLLLYDAGSQTCYLNVEVAKLRDMTLSANDTSTLFVSARSKS